MIRRLEDWDATKASAELLTLVGRYYFDWHPTIDQCVCHL
jgi:hypothetical protein